MMMPTQQVAEQRRQLQDAENHDHDDRRGQQQQNQFQDSKVMAGDRECALTQTNSSTRDFATPGSALRSVPWVILARHDRVGKPRLPSAGRSRSLGRARVLDIEARAVPACASRLDQQLSCARSKSFSVASGRVVVSGIGKSGHIARKIASTLASTGTPAFFVHPAEASHGDLGMVTRDDVLIALSNSGESARAARDRAADQAPGRAS